MRNAHRNSACTWLQQHRQKQSTHNSSASHRTHRTHSRPLSLASHRTHRVKTSKRIHIEHIESDQEKKNSALTTEKKGKIEREYSQIETVQFVFCFFSYRQAVEVEVEEQWRRRQRERNAGLENRETERLTERQTAQTKRRERESDMYFFWVQRQVWNAINKE